MKAHSLTLGAIQLDAHRCAFRAWAPKAQKVEVHFVTPGDRIVPLLKQEGGYHGAIVENVSPGSDYLYRLDGNAERPDPVSRWQPNGVHGPSRILEPHYEWKGAQWFGLPWREFILYELHVGNYGTRREGLRSRGRARMRSIRRLPSSRTIATPRGQGRFHGLTHRILTCLRSDRFGRPTACSFTGALLCDRRCPWWLT
jgi:1,4-alpha-glucan branching enzyme